MLTLNKDFPPYLYNKWESFILKFINNIKNTLVGKIGLHLGLFPYYIDNFKLSHKFYVLNLMQKLTDYDFMINRNLYADYTNLPFENNSIDCILSIHALDTLHNYEQIQQCIKEISRVLSFNSKLIIIGFNPYGLWFMRHKLQKKIFKKSFLPSVINHNLGINYLSLQNILQDNSMRLAHAEFSLYDLPFDNFNHPKISLIFDNIGKRWLPNFANIYSMVFIKEVLGMHAIEVNRSEIQYNSLNLFPAIPKDELTN